MRLHLFSRRGGWSMKSWIQDEYRANQFGCWALFVMLAIPSILIAAILWMTAVPGQSWLEPLPPLTAEQTIIATNLEHNVRAVAREPHNVQHPEALERSALHIENALTDMGYAVTRQPFQAAGQKVRNIETVIEAANRRPETLVIGAHYDSYSFAPGANDNGSGTAAVLELARLLRDLQNKSDIRIRLVLFVNEEPPFFKRLGMGSMVYAKRLKASGEPLIGMISLETMGYYSDKADSQHYPTPLNLLYPSTGNFVAFVSTTSSRNFLRKTVGAFRSHARFPSVGGTAPAFITGIDWSDHWSFEQVGIPALMATDTAIFRYPHYHRRQDTPDKVDYQKMARVVSGLEQMIRYWAMERD